MLVPAAASLTLDLCQNIDKKAQHDNKHLKDNVLRSPSRHCWPIVMLEMTAFFIKGHKEQWSFSSKLM